MARLLPIILSLFAAASGPVRSRAVQHPSNIPSPPSVLWIAAHPDDEALAAPLLGKWCREEHARCAFLIMTRGEAGSCLRPNGCEPDLASVRSAEAGSAAQYFGADLILLTYPNTAGVTKPVWRTSSGDRPDVVQTVATYIEAFHPALLLTFDPRHGTTCHPDHMETGSIVLDAVKRLSYEPDVYLLETRVTFTFDPLVLHFAPASRGLQRYDAREILPSTQMPAWSEIMRDMERHPSQFNESALTAIQNVPLTDRAVYFAPAKSILDQNVAGCQ
jgi:LmbE family N-acetylglucosaminyl deacetylase